MVNHFNKSRANFSSIVLVSSFHYCNLALLKTEKKISFAANFKSYYSTRTQTGLRFHFRTKFCFGVR